MKQVRPQLDLPKNSQPLPPPLPSNWERKELSNGKVALLIEALPTDDASADKADEEEGYRFYIETCAFTQVYKFCVKKKKKKKNIYVYIYIYIYIYI